jgi:UrcA family protein
MTGHSGPQFNLESKETNMFMKTAALAAIAVAATFAGAAVLAKDHTVTVAVHVSTKGLDLRQPADAKTFYARLQQAAYVVCTHGNRVDLAPADDEKRCYERALGDSIRVARQPLLTQLYLQTHTLQEAAARGIEFEPEVAAR